MVSQGGIANRNAQHQGSSEDERESLIKAIYAYVLQRLPSDTELRSWSDAAVGMSATELLERFGNSTEYTQRHRVKPFFPVGHYYSPIVDPETLGDYVSSRSGTLPADLEGIDIDTESMFLLWNRYKTLIQDAPFPEKKSSSFRFFFDGAPFPYGDALTLHALMAHFRPRRITEIGSGFSTACMLDAADLHGNTELRIRCIEPDPTRLRHLLNEQDWNRINLHDVPVQKMAVSEIVGDLEAGDILFIDSTHVLKTGSDVHYEIFQLIPAVRPGVIIHIHDCPYPFEYSEQWISKNYSWNETYAIRAFLMFNKSFDVLFWGSLLRFLDHNRIAREGGRFAQNVGTSLWLRRLA